MFPLAKNPIWQALRVMAFATIILCGGIWYFTSWGNVMTRLRVGESSTSSGSSHHGTNATSDTSAEQSGQRNKHPIERLMDDAQKRFESLMNWEAYTLADAAKNYRKRRGRHPPPGFDAWYNFAQTHGAIVVEPFFDQIYTDLAPLRGIEPHRLRQTANTFSLKITIRNGTIAAKKEFLYEKLAQTASMLRDLGKHQNVPLPDLDIPVNVNDAPAMLVPWETIDTALQFAKPILTPLNETIDEYGVIDDGETPAPKFDPEWLHGRERHTSAQWLGQRPFWSLVRPACPPGSPTRVQPLMQDIWHREGHTKEEHLASALLPMDLPSGTYAGFVQNSTSALSVCQHPSWQGLHGAFVAPAQYSVTQKLFPLFSTSKLAVSNEILIPSTGDWTTSNISSSMTMLWNDREGKLYWRGPATGGKNTADNWQRFHRHRFVAMLNATHVEIAEGLIHAGNESIIGLGYAKNFRLLPANPYNLETQRGAKMAEWVNSWGDAAFTDLQCSESAENGTCPYKDEYFSVHPQDTSSSRNKPIAYKYAAILDGDGADENGTFVSALQSGTLTLKASVYRQWHDSRVIPWLHFIPLDTTLVDLYAVMEFFRGSQVRGDAGEFAHAHIEMEKHKHHFNGPPSKKQRRYEQESYNDEHDIIPGTDETPAADGNDERAQRVAKTGKEWATKALSRNDALIYVYRLLLEYARIKDDRREILGWVEDLLEEERKSGGRI